MKDHRLPFIAYAMHKARTWRPECKACFLSILTYSFEEERWSRPEKCTCLGLPGLTNDELDEVKAIIVKAVCRRQDIDNPIMRELSTNLNNFQKNRDLIYPKYSMRCVNIDLWCDFRFMEDKQGNLMVRQHNKTICSICFLLHPICAVWLNLRRNTLSLCLKRLGICKDMRIYIAKMIKCGNSVSL